MYGKYSIKHNLIFIDKLQEITSNYQSSMHQKLKGRSSKPSPKISAGATQQTLRPKKIYLNGAFSLLIK